MWPIVDIFGQQLLFYMCLINHCDLLWIQVFRLFSLPSGFRTVIRPDAGITSINQGLAAVEETLISFILLWMSCSGIKYQAQLTVIRWVQRTVNYSFCWASWSRGAASSGPHTWSLRKHRLRISSKPQNRAVKDADCSVGVPGSLFSIDPN